MPLYIQTWLSSSSHSRHLSFDCKRRYTNNINLKWIERVNSCLWKTFSHSCGKKRWKVVLSRTFMCHTNWGADHLHLLGECFITRLFVFPPWSRLLFSSCKSLKQPWHKEMRKEGMVLLRSWTAGLPAPLTHLVLPPQHKYLFVLLTLSTQVLPRLKTSRRWSTMLSGKAAGECRHQPPLPSAQGLLSSTCWFLAFLVLIKWAKSPCVWEFGAHKMVTGSYKFWIFAFWAVYWRYQGSYVSSPLWKACRITHAALAWH